MKRLLISTVLAIASVTAQGEPYVLAGGSFGADHGGLSIGAGVRSSNIGLEAQYLNEQHSQETVSDQGGGVTITDSTRSVHGISLGLVGFAPIGELRATGATIELIGRAARERLRSGNDEEWRTAIGAGLQYGERHGWALRLLLERAGEETRGALSVIRAF